MMDFDLTYKKLHEHAKPPEKAHDSDLAWDLYACEDVVIPSFNRKLIRTGISIGFPTMVGGILKDRSGVASKQGLFIHAGVIDPGYTGEILVLMYNSTRKPIEVRIGMKIAQMILMPTFQVANFYEVTEVAETERGDKGFGSSGT